MSSTAAGNFHTSAERSTSHDELTSHQKLLRQRRLESYLKEPTSGGNRLVEATGQPIDEEHGISASKDKMASKIESIMLPFKNANGGH